MKKILAALFVLFFAFGTAYAQRTVSGTITDDGGVGLIGANVLVKGTTVGTITDLDGNYSLNVPAGNEILVISYTGYQDREVVLGSSNIVNSMLKIDSEVFDEIIITGYGTEIKREVTSSISSIKAEELEGLPLQSFDKAIQGKAAGVQITSNTGAPGGGAEIRIRGVGSISASSDPLIIVDGVQLGTLGGSSQGSSNPLNGINPNDIESIEILKDASSTAIYGAQGANGIIVVTTKSGKRDAKPRFTLSYQEGVVQPYNLYEMMNSQQYVDIRAEALANAGGSREDAFDTYGNPDDPDLPYENWIDVLWRDAKYRTADLSFSGGGESVDYYSSVAYELQESQIITNEWERITGRFNLNADLSDRLALNLRTTLSWTEQEGSPCDGGFFVNCPFAPSFWSIPVSPALDENGDYNVYPLTGGSHNFSFNELQNAENVTRLGRTVEAINSLTLGYEVIDNLTLRGQFGINVINNRDVNVRPTSIPFFRDAWGGQVFNRSRLTTNWNTNFTANYDFDLGDLHGLSALVGYEFRRVNFYSSDATGRGFADASFVNLNSAATPFGVAGTSTTNRREGIFASAKYDYDGKYIVNGTVRRDGSSRFGANNRYGVFYSGSIGWRITEESFFNFDAINELKLRISYGITGNSEIGDFDALAEFGTRGQYLGAPGLAPIRLANDLLGWETAAQTDIGLDFSLWENRIYGALDFWNKDNRDLLLDTQIPATSGLQNTTITENVGSINNKGIDFELNAVAVNTGGFKLTVGGTFSVQKNQITSLNMDRDTIFSGGYPQFIVGEPIHFFNLHEFAGVNPANGRIMAVDADGNLTYSPGVDDVKIYDGAIPDYFGGFRTEAEYRGFSVYGFFQFQGGHHLFNNDFYALATASADEDNQLVSQAEYWREPGDITNVHMPINGGVIEGISQDDFGLIGTTQYYSDASYVRLKEIKVAYRLSRDVLDKINLGGVTFFAQGINMATWTGFNGIDPEVLSTRQAYTGSSSFAFPQGKQYSGGIQVTF